MIGSFKIYVIATGLYLLFVWSLVVGVAELLGVEVW